MIKVLVPSHVGDEVVIRFAGDDPRTYRVVESCVEVEERYLDDFLALHPGAKPAPVTSTDAKPASEER